MEIKYKEKPTKEQVEQYCNKLKEYLSAHKISVEVELWDSPARISSFIDNVLTEIEYNWIKKVKILSPEVKEMGVELFSSGIDENTNNNTIWTDAFCIQDQYYKKLNRIPKFPRSDDPYWKLWEYVD